MEFGLVGIGLNIKKMCGKVRKEGMKWVIGWFYEVSVGLFRWWREINERNVGIMGG